MDVGLYSDGKKVQKFNLQDEVNRHLFDMDINCHRHTMQAHRIILTSRSGYFRDFFRRHPAQQSINLDHIASDIMQKVIEVIYGEVVVAYEKLDEFQRALTFLRLNHWVKYHDASERRAPMPSRNDSTEESSDSFSLEANPEQANA